MDVGGANTRPPGTSVRNAGRGGQEAAVPKIDVSRYVREMEEMLRSQQDPAQRGNAIAILLRWQFDEMLDDTSRAKAKTLVQEFAVALRTGDREHYGRSTAAGRSGRRS